jgi:riboflavin synthase
MFTGIVTAVGEIRSVQARGGDLRLSIDGGSLGLEDVAVGDSIAVSGVCLTVVHKEDNSFSVDVSQETLTCTAGLEVARKVNLEKALRLSDRLGGHLVSGHVDGVGEVFRFEPAGESRLLVVRTPGELARYIAPKGSVTVDGVSLTINRVAGAQFTVNLIPHTLTVTTLGELQPGARVNLEVDLLARYVFRLLEASNTIQEK